MRNELEGKVILEGEQSNPYPYVKSAHIYVHSSYVESQGLTILEAMALGIPCVVNPWALVSLLRMALMVF